MLEIGVFSAVLQYNNGAGGIINVMKRISIQDYFSILVLSVKMIRQLEQLLACHLRPVKRK